MLEADGSKGAAPPNSPASTVSLDPASDQTFEPFYVAHYHRVVALAVVLSGDRAEAEDLAQEAFSVAHGRWGDLQRYDNPGAWVRRVVANKAVSSYRRRQTEAHSLRKLPTPQSSGLPYGVEHRAELWAAVRELPNRQAQAVALYYLGDRSVAATAELMEVSEGAVNSHLSRARRALAQKLGLEDEQ